MQTGVKQVFYFNASANSLGGYIDNPFRPIPTPSSVALSPTGGSVINRAVGFAFEKIASCKVAYTFVTGRPLKINGPWTHRVVSVVEGFSLLGDKVTADRLVAQAFVEEAAGGGKRLVSFAGSHFENLRVQGKPVTAAINPSFVPQQDRPVDAYDQNASVEPTLPLSSFWSLSYRQASTYLQNKSTPQWVHDRYSWVAATKSPDQPNPAGYTICSLVDKIDGLAAGPTYGHCFELPDVGRVFLGELTVHPHATSLTMIRAELGCAISGHASAASIVSNGTSCPPSVVSSN
jgi:hypothetical protein